jgi:hypothetical protein
MKDLSDTPATILKGFRFPGLSFGPLSDASALRLATLVGDFHPSNLLRPPAQASGGSSLTAHRLWVALLVDAGLSRLGPWVRLPGVTLEFRSDATTGEQLSLDMRVESSQDQTGTVVVSFAVTASRGKLVATGTAQVMPLER